jgi:hypothetical protein
MPKGPRGPKGQIPWAPQAPAGHEGRSLPKQLTPLIEEWDANAIAQFVPGLLLEVLLDEGEHLYLNGKLVDASEKLKWVSQLATASTNPATVALSAVVPLPNAEANAQEQRTRSARLANKLLSQLRLGFDYYGYPRNFVPLVDITYYEDSLKLLFKVGKSLETECANFWQRSDDIGIYKTSLNTAISSLQTTIQTEEQRRVQLVGTATDILSEIRTLSDTAGKLEVQLQEADRDFHQALSRQSNGCGLSDLLTVVQAIVTIVAAVYTGGTAMWVGIAGAAASSASVAEDLQKQDPNAPVTDEAINKYRIKHLEMVGEGVGKLKDAYTKYQELLKDRDNHNVKIAVNEDDFEKQLQPYLDMREALKYRDLMRSYVDLCKTRNNKLVEFTGNALEQADITLRNSQRDVTLNSFKDRLAIPTTQSLDVEVVKNDLQIALNDCKKAIIRTLYAAHRALEYWALDVQELSIVDQTIAQLEGTFGQWKTNCVSFVESRNGSPQVFSNVTVELKKDEMPNMFSRFIKDGVLDFTLSVDQGGFHRFDAAVLVSGVHVEVPNAETTDRTYKFNLTHNGRGWFRTQDRKLIDFTHRPRPTTEVYQLKTDGSIDAAGPNQGNLLGAQEGKYAYLSPFAHWTLKMPKDQNPGLKLDDVTTVKLTFKGYSLPFRT